MSFVQGAVESAVQEAPSSTLPLADAAHASPLAGVVLIAFALSIAPLALWLGRKITGPKEQVTATWGLAHVAIVAVVFLAPQAALYAVAWFSQLAQSAPAGEPANARIDVAAALVSSAALFLLTAALAWRCVSTTTTQPAAAVGVARPNVVRVLGAALVLFVLAFAVQTGLGILWASALRAMGVTETEQPLAKLMLDVPHAQRALVLVIGVAIVPFLEEFLFRGFLQPALARYMRPAAAIVVTSLVFGALHGKEAFAPIAGLSIVLGIARVQTGAIWVPWVLHALNNGAAFVGLWYATESGAV